jgi:UMF1 family MFS transporter
MVRLSPRARLGEFFGIYGLVGKASQVIGSLIYGVIVFLFVDRFGNLAYQIAVLSLFVTMLVGLWLVWPVRDDVQGLDDTEPDAGVPPQPRPIWDQPA